MGDFCHSWVDGSSCCPGLAGVLAPCAQLYKFALPSSNIGLGGAMPRRHKGGGRRYLRSGALVAVGGVGAARQIGGSQAGLHSAMGLAIPARLRRSPLGDRGAVSRKARTDLRAGARAPGKSVGRCRARSARCGRKGKTDGACREGWWRRWQCRVAASVRARSQEAGGDRRSPAARRACRCGDFHRPPARRQSSLRRCGSVRWQWGQCSWLRHVSMSVHDCRCGCPTAGKLAGLRSTGASALQAPRDRQAGLRRRLRATSRPLQK